MSFGPQTFSIDGGRGTPVLGVRLLVSPPPAGHPVPTFPPPDARARAEASLARPRVAVRQQRQNGVAALAVLASIALHWAAFGFGPTMTAADFRRPVETLTAIELPPQIEIPPAPAGIARPAVPVAATVPVSEDITIAPTTFLANAPFLAELPPPPAEVAVEVSEEPTFTPFTTAPQLRNRAEAAAAIASAYPKALRDAGIGGRVMMWFYIDQAGRVVRTRVATSSGHAKLDEAAEGVAPVLAFSPAANRERPVPVWVQIPIVFSVETR